MEMASSVLREYLYAGNPHVRLDGGDVASYSPTVGRPEGFAMRGAKPRGGSLLYKGLTLLVIALLLGSFAFSEECEDPLEGPPPVIEVRDMPQSATGRLLKKINVGWKCQYSKSFQSRPQLRGVMVHGRHFGSNKDFADLRDWGATVVRLPITCAGGTNLVLHAESVDKWLEHVVVDLLPRAEKYGIGLIPCLFAVPGDCAEKGDVRMFNDNRYLNAFRATWRTIARRLKGRRMIYGYDLFNEPHQTQFASVADYWTVQRLTAEDIRAIDPEVPVIIEAYGWDGPEAFWAMSPMKLTNIVYEVHMYYPMAFTHQGLYKRQAGVEYPCASNGWNRAFLEKTLTQVRDFERTHGARIYCGEFSAVAWAKGADLYIADCISLFNRYGWDWTYHAFREFEGWSVEHEGPDRWHCRDVPDTARKRALLKGLRAKCDFEPMNHR